MKVNKIKVILVISVLLNIVFYAYGQSIQRNSIELSYENEDLKLNIENLQNELNNAYKDIEYLQSENENLKNQFGDFANG